MMFTVMTYRTSCCVSSIALISHAVWVGHGYLHRFAQAVVWESEVNASVDHLTMESLTCAGGMRAEKGIRRKALPIPKPNPECKGLIHVAAHMQHEVLWV